MNKLTKYNGLLTSIVYLSIYRLKTANRMEIFVRFTDRKSGSLAFQSGHKRCIPYNTIKLLMN